MPRRRVLYPNPLPDLYMWMDDNRDLMNDLALYEEFNPHHSGQFMKNSPKPLRKKKRVKKKK